MRPAHSRRYRLHVLVYATLAPIAAAWSGCGSSSITDAKLTDEARKSVFQKKADVQHRTASPRRSKNQAKPG